MTTITIRLNADLNRLIAKAARLSGKSRSEIARGAIRRHLVVSQFDRLGRQMMPFAKAQGYLTDEEVFRDVF